jgi:hypothetical protein
MRSSRTPPLLLFATISAGLHAAVFVGIERSTAASKLAFDSSAPPLTGETLEVEPTTEEEPALSNATSASSAAHTPTPTAAPNALPLRSSARAPARASDSEADAAAASTALFGAVGVRFAADLATTFTRAFPQAASADPIWMTVPLGNAGTAEVKLLLDEDGRLATSAVEGAPSAALRRGIERTVVLLSPRAFTARGAITKLHIRARVSRDDLHDGLHGDVFALSGGSFSGSVGTAFFALPSSSGPGRRIDVEVRLEP